MEWSPRDEKCENAMIAIATLDAIRPCLDLRLIFMVHLPAIRAYHSRYGAAASGLANEKQVRKEPARELIRSVSHRHSNFLDKCHTIASHLNAPMLIDE